MKYIILTALTAIAVGAADTVHAGNERSPIDLAQLATAPEVTGKTTLGATSAASLNALLAEWKQAGFSAPSKPGQYRVYGRNGYVTNGGGYNYMVALIRSAAKDTQEGRESDAATKIAKARSLLAASNLRKE